MGSAHAPAPIDVRVEKCIKKFSVPQRKVEELWHLYTRHDVSGSGYLGIDELFIVLLKYPRSPLTDAIPGFLDTKSEATVNFGEFVEMVCTFACFEQLDLLRFMFFILDPQKIGVVEKHELKLFFVKIWRNRMYKNVQEAMDYLDSIDDNGTYNFREICELRTTYPNIFYPIYQFQQHVINNTLGEAWWDTHKAYLLDAKIAAQHRELMLAKKRQKEKEKANDLVSEEVLRQRMGVRYYLMPWRIAFERNRLAKIAAIEQDIDRQFQELAVGKQLGSV